MDTLRYVVTIIAILAAAAGFGADVFGAIALRPALSHLDEAKLTESMGRIHQYADRHLRAPFVVGMLGAAFSVVAAIITRQVLAAVLCGVAVVAMISWIVIYSRVAAPVNRVLTAAAIAGQPLPNARALQDRWESVIVLRVVVQTLILAALGSSLAVS